MAISDYLTGNARPGPARMAGYEQRLLQFFKDMEAQGYPVRAYSHFRDVDYQARLFKAAVAKYGSEEAADNWVARPSTKAPHYESASDLNFNNIRLGSKGSEAATRAAHATAKKYGLHFPMAHEPWHIEPIERRNPGYSHAHAHDTKASYTPSQVQGQGSGFSQTIIPKAPSFLDLIGQHEGTDRGRGYNETFGYGKFAGGDYNLTDMTLSQVLALQDKMRQHPANKGKSTPVGRYQIVKGTLQSMMNKLSLSPDTKFTPAIQDQMALQLLKQRGNDPAALRKEWASLVNVPDSTIMASLQQPSSPLQDFPAAANPDSAVTQYDDSPLPQHQVSAPDGSIQTASNQTSAYKPPSPEQAYHAYLAQARNVVRRSSQNVGQWPGPQII